MATKKPANVVDGAPSPPVNVWARRAAERDGVNPQNPALKSQDAGSPPTSISLLQIQEQERAQAKKRAFEEEQMRIQMQLLAQQQAAASRFVKFKIFGTFHSTYLPYLQKLEREE